MYSFATGLLTAALLSPVVRAVTQNFTLDVAANVIAPDGFERRYEIYTQFRQILIRARAL